LLASAAVPAEYNRADMATSPAELSDRHAYSGAVPSDDPVAAAHRETLCVFERLGPTLRRYAQSCGVPEMTADDVIQEVYVALFRHLCLGRSGENLTAWLFQVTYRTALRTRRRLQTRLAVEEPWDPTLGDRVADDIADPERALVERERRRRLRGIVRALPERSRRCLLLRAQGLRYREIATTLQLSLGGVAKAIALGVRRLSTAVKE
jgi:RNA polymerase sigma-70 factor, ECF subfamily